MKKLYIKPEFDPCELETEVIAGSKTITSIGGALSGDDIVSDSKERDDWDDFDNEW